MDIYLIKVQCSWNWLVLKLLNNWFSENSIIKCLYNSLSLPHVSIIFNVFNNFKNINLPFFSVISSLGYCANCLIQCVLFSYAVSRWMHHLRFALATRSTKFKSINYSVLSLLYGPLLTSIHDYWKKSYIWLHGPLLVKWCLCVLTCYVGLS